jgi:drug/metabolite transporter (DMT)-like permease
MLFTYLFCNFKQHVTHIVASTGIIIGGILAKIWGDQTIQLLQWLGVFFVLMAAVFDYTDEREIVK